MSLSAAELSLLRFTHSPPTVPPCRVCGAELEIASMGGGNATKYVCSSDDAKVIGRPGGIFGAVASEASDHRQASEVRITYHGDRQVLAVIDELLDRRMAAGDVVEVEVGEKIFAFPRDIMPYVHVGDGRWERQLFCHEHDTLGPRCPACDEATALGMEMESKWIGGGLVVETSKPITLGEVVRMRGRYRKGQNGGLLATDATYVWWRVRPAM